MEPQYPRTIKLDSPKLFSMIREQESIILEGREISEDIESLEKQMDSIDQEVQEAEKKADLSALDDESKVITETFNKAIADMEALKKRIYEHVKKSVPPELVEKYESVKKDKEALEEKRNKCGLKIQKKRDKIIPLGQKLMKPFIQNQFEDYDTIRIENGELVATIFNHLEDFKERFLKRKK